ncbi:YraN family protein [Edaphobacter sp. 4G125]|nr:YraN family protein [Edaphobacter sp. 4G125]
MAFPAQTHAVTGFRPLGSRWLDAQAWTLRRLYALHRTRSAQHLETGALGEREALFYLRRVGYIIVARRWRTAKLRGDLDLIGWHGETLCFIEIKTRSQRDTFAAELAVDDDKQRTLRRLARAYLHRLPVAAREAATRFDVVSLYLAGPQSQPEFVLNQGAFEWE